MIKVKIDRPAPNVFYVEDGYTVSYSDDVLEVMNEDEEVIAVFRSWLYAMPTDEVEEDEEGEDEGGVATQVLGELEVAQADFLSDLDTASYAHVNSHGDHESLADETGDPVA